MQTNEIGDRVVTGFVADDTLASGELVAGWHDSQGAGHVRLALTQDVLREGVFIATATEHIKKGQRVEFVYEAKVNRSRARLER